MKSFAKEFLRDPAPDRSLFLAAFGKHPGWDDHMDDLGFETESLLAAKGLLYQGGIGANLDSGAWEKIPEEQRLASCDHIFVWRRCDQVIVGRMWPSKDGKNRARFPMVVCAQLCGTVADDAVDLLLPALLHIEAACQATRSADEVRAIIDSAREQLREAARAPGGESDPVAGVRAEDLGVMLADLWTRFAAYLPGAFNAKRGAPAAHFRFPAGAGNAPESLLVWLRVLSTQLDPDAPVLVLEPAREHWVDVIVGEPTAEQFFCLRAAEEAVPFSLELGARGDAVLQERGRATAAALLGGDPVQVPSPAKRWFQLFGE